MIPLALLLAGYPLAVRLPETTAAQRLAFALLIGLALMCWNVSVAGFFGPIAGLPAWLCLWPVALGLLDARARRGLAGDAGVVWRMPQGRLLAGLVLLFLSLLLWPLLRQPALVFYDGRSNHDAFFWISGAEFLRSHSYMVEPEKSALQPFLNGTGVISGWLPQWGRMGGEGLLALLSAVTGMEVIRLYLWASAALFLPWVAATYLVARTFFLRGLAWPAVLGLGALQPLFVFFHGNGNLPNLLGVLMAAAGVVALSRATAAEQGSGIFWGVFALCLHGLLVCFPEMGPFLLLSAGLVWMRELSRLQPPARGPVIRAASLAILAALALNPATTIRAGAGYLASLRAVRADEIWANIFRHLDAADYPLALATLNVHTPADLGSLASAGAGAIVLFGAWLAIRRAPGPLAAGALFAGPLLLLAYTALAGFSYGWQKVAQVAGVFSAALFSVAAPAVLAGSGTATRRIALARTLAAALMLIFSYATVRNIYEGWKWSGRKALTEDWFTLRHWAADNLPGQPVLVEATSFRYPYFHGMWAVYVLARSHPLFPVRGHDHGGYLRDYTRVESGAVRPAAILVSPEWARTVEANSRRLWESPSVVVVAESNRVVAAEGLFPATGVPEKTAARWRLELRPHDAAHLQLTLQPAPGVSVGDVTWQVTAATEARERFSATLTGPPPWHLSVPLAPSALNRITATAEGAPDSGFPFVVAGLRVN